MNFLWDLYTRGDLGVVILQESNYVNCKMFLFGPNNTIPKNIFYGNSFLMRKKHLTDYP